MQVHREKKRADPFVAVGKGMVLDYEVQEMGGLFFHSNLFKTRFSASVFDLRSEAA